VQDLSQVGREPGGRAAVDDVVVDGQCQVEDVSHFDVVADGAWPSTDAATARALGATQTLLAGEANEIASVQADIVLESSGSHRGLASGIRGAARAGRIVMVGLLPSGDQPVPISLAITRELELVGAFRFNGEIDEVIAALADGTLYVDPRSHP
jgi:threonine dehydrogenase-like Zn-dependent dehydrogenase